MLKQHLYRHHSRPKHYCPICYRQFENRNETDIHIQQQSCSQIPEDPFSDKMSDDMFAKIKLKKRGDQEELWYEIFFTLFPGEPRPYSPYASDEKTVCHLFNVFVSLGPRAAQIVYQTVGAATGSTALPDLTQAIVQEAYERFIGLVAQQPANLIQGTPGDDEPWHASLMPDAGSQIDPRLTSPLSPIRPAGIRYRADSGIGTESLLGPSTPNHAAVTLPSHPGNRNAMHHQYPPRPPLGQINIMQNPNFNQLDAGMLPQLAQSGPQMQTLGFDMPDSATFDYSSTTLSSYQQPFHRYGS